MKKGLILLLCVFICGCSNKNEYLKDEVININILTTDILLYSDISLKDIISNNNIDIENPNLLLKTDTIGEKQIELKYIYENKKYIKTIDYNVIDDVSPTPISVPGILTTKINEDFYPCENIVVADNYDKKIDCKIDGYYDLTNIGSYDVKYVFSDSSGNITNKKLTINVVENIDKNTSTQTTQKKYYLSNILENYKNENTEIGIDISKYQGDIDFIKVKNAGISFVIMRLGIQAGIDYELSMDTYFEQNYKLAKDAGLKIGVYLYSTATNTKIAKEHANWLLNVLNNRELDFPIAFDWENWKYFNEYELTTHQLSKTYYSFKDTLKENGYDAMLYSSKYYLENIWELNSNSDIWLAHYTDKTNYQGNYNIWQMCNTGIVDGINGYVDIDILYKKS